MLAWLQYQPPADENALSLIISRNVPKIPNEMSCCACLGQNLREWVLILLARIPITNKRSAVSAGPLLHLLGRTVVWTTTLSYAQGGRSHSRPTVKTTGKGCLPPASRSCNWSKRWKRKSRDKTSTTSLTQSEARPAPFTPYQCSFFCVTALNQIPGVALHQQGP